jgi:4-amino-4-deoxy-L-arabinose transferase-like glycosyltransferase
MTGLDTSPNSRKTFLVLVVLLTLAGLFLRFYRLSNQSLWTDEVSSITVAQAPLDKIYELSTKVNNSLPTYFLVLRWVLGNAEDQMEWRARALSAVAGALSIPLLVGVAWHWRRHRGAALLAGLLLAVNPLHIWYSQEVRAYALMAFFGLLALFCFERARSGRGPLWWGGYLVSAMAAIALHKTALVFPVACFLWHGWQVFRNEARGKGLFIHAPVGVAVLITLALKSYPPGEGMGRPSSPLEVIYTFMTFVGGYSFGPSPAEIQAQGAWAAVSRHPAQAGILFAILILLAMVCALNWRQFIFSKETSLVALGIGVVVAGAAFSAFPYNVRYTLPALLAFLALVAGLSISARKLFWGRLALGGVLMVAIWADVQWFHDPIYRKGDSRAIARWLAQNRDQVKSWTVLPGYLGASVQWYLRTNSSVLSGFSPPKEEQTTSFPPVPDVLIIGRRHHIQQPDQLIAAYRAAAGEVKTNVSFAGFELYSRGSSPLRAAPGGQ